MPSVFGAVPQSQSLVLVVLLVLRRLVGVVSVDMVGWIVVAACFVGYTLAAGCNLVVCFESLAVAGSLFVLVAIGLSAAATGRLFAVATGCFLVVPGFVSIVVVVVVALASSVPVA